MFKFNNQTCDYLTSLPKWLMPGVSVIVHHAQQFQVIEYLYLPFNSENQDTVVSVLLLLSTDGPGIN